MNIDLIFAGGGLVILLAIVAYSITRPPQNSHKRKWSVASMTPLPPRMARGTTNEDKPSVDDAVDLLAATLPPETSDHHHSHHHEHATAPVHETHAAPSHDHGSSYGGDSYGGSHHDGGSYGGHDSGSGGGFDGGGFDGGGGHGH